jgi:hypothetical protein
VRHFVVVVVVVVVVAIDVAVVVLVAVVRISFNDHLASPLMSTSSCSI